MIQVYLYDTLARLLEHCARGFHNLSLLKIQPVLQQMAIDPQKQE
jgi:hypothetical protein